MPTPLENKRARQRRYLKRLRENPEKRKRLNDRNKRWMAEYRIREVLEDLQAARAMAGARLAPPPPPPERGYSGTLKSGHF